VAVAAGGGAAWSLLAFTAAVITVSTWQPAVALNRYRHTH
jgi:hypothetical protein